MALLLLSTRRASEAIPYLEKAVQADPSFGGAYQDLGYAYFNQGRLDDAIRTSELAVARNPDNPNTYSNLLFFTAHDHRLAPADVFEKHLEFGRRFETPLLSSHRPHENDRDPERRLRIGFVSGDFYDHAVASFIEPVLRKLDTNRFDLYAFHNTVKFDAVSERLKPLFKFWVSVPHVSDKDLAEIVRACRIDILIDLSGHTAGHRLLAFARKPAPVQVTWVGYPNTTGLVSMDYHFADRFGAPKGLFDAYFTEKIVRLPSGGTFSHPPHAPEPGPLPALANGFFTFASFNRLGKISAPTLDLWCQVLRACPTSRMLVAAVSSDEAGEALTVEFEQRGIARERLMLHRTAPSTQYFELHHRADMVLDTFPYNGGTTSYIALWMGVPVMTKQGNSRMSNAGAGVMARVGLDDFVALDDADFVRRAVAWAERHGELAEIRANLRKRILGNKYRDMSFIVAGIERAFRMIWRNWCAGGAPISLDVPEQD